jgi:hypothetical protein
LLDSILLVKDLFPSCEKKLSQKEQKVELCKRFSSDDKVLARSIETGARMQIAAFFVSEWILDGVSDEFER